VKFFYPILAELALFLPNRQNPGADMDPSASNRTLTVTDDILPPETTPATGALALTPAGQAALAAAQALAKEGHLPRLGRTPTKRTGRILPTGAPPPLQFHARCAEPRRVGSPGRYRASTGQPGWTAVWPCCAPDCPSDRKHFE
jgi:hypothetical protein